MLIPDVLEAALTYQPMHRSRRDEVSDELIRLRGGECQACGYSYDGENAHHFDWHHRDPTTKKFSIATQKMGRRADLLAEVAKCDLLCKLCHADRHKGMPRVKRREHTVYWERRRRMKRLSVVNFLDPRGGVLVAEQEA